MCYPKLETRLMKKKESEMVRIAPAHRYDFIIHPSYEKTTIRGKDSRMFFE